MKDATISIPDYEFPPGALLGKGAFGSVWVGLYKDDLPRAVKVFRPGGIHEASWRSEYEKLRSLDEPPGIVTLYDCGHTDDGSPYVSMRLMADRLPGGEWSGRTLSRSLDEGGLSRGERWRLVEELAEPLAYLHRKGVKHCDVKPSNILLTAGDEPRPVLCDFGQSRVSLGEGTAFGTAFYASPEQLREPDRPAEHWDVYSFGATAYQIVTGKLPRMQGLFDQISEGGLCTGAAASLDQTLIDQRSTPADVYGWQLPSPGALAAMIDREPLLAAPEGLGAAERGRFEVILRCLEIGDGGAGRYQSMEEVIDAFAEVERRILVAKERRKNSVLATMMVFGLVAACAAGWQLLQANTARRATGDALVIAREERSLAHSFNAEAGRQRDRARGAKGLSEKLVNRLLYDLRDDLEPLGRLDLLDQVSRDAEAYFAALPEGERGAGSERERSTMLNFRGDVHLAGDALDLATECFTESLAIRRKLLADEPDSTTLMRDVSVSLERMSELSRREGEFDGARAALEEVISIRRGLVVHGDSPSAALRDLARGLQKLGQIQLQSGAVAEATASLTESVSALTDVPIPLRDRQLVATLILLGDACRADGQSDMALRHYRDANWRSQKRLARSPENVELQNDVAAGALRAADMMLDMGDDEEEALIAYATARQTLTDLLATSPESVPLRTHLALTDEKISGLKRRGGDLAGAGESLLRARKLIDAILAGDASEAARRHSARIERKYGEHLSDADQPAAARAAFDRAIEILAGLPDEPEHCIAHVVCLYNLYVLAREGGDTRSALNYCSRSLLELRELESKKMLEPEHGNWIALLKNDQQKLAQLEPAQIR